MPTYGSPSTLTYLRPKIVTCVIFSFFLVALARRMWVREAEVVLHEEFRNHTADDSRPPRLHLKPLPNEMPVDIEALLQMPLINETQGLTAIFPVSSGSLPQFSERVKPLLQSQILSQVIITYPQAIFAQVSQTSYQAVLFSGVPAHKQPELSLLPLSSSSGYIMQALAIVSTEYVLVLDEDGLQGIEDDTIRGILLQPRAFPNLVGPHGFPQNVENLTCLGETQLVSHLSPPFVGPRTLLDDPSSFSAQHPLKTLPETFSGPPGIMIKRPQWCEADKVYKADLTSNFSNHIPVDHSFLTGVFAVMLLDIKQFYSLSHMLCNLQMRGHRVWVLLASHWQKLDIQDLIEIDLESSTAIFRGTCHIRFDTFDDTLSSGNAWFSTLPFVPDVTITTGSAWAVSGLLPTFRNANYSSYSTLVMLPADDLSYCSWMASLSLEEWKRWSIPVIDLSIITKNRPQSLERLLESLAKARFFGDKVNLRINIEQDADNNTLGLVSSSRSWSHGVVTLHRRIVQGGLLPAVVESWYPNSDDNYGILLEDDIEVSPMFYAWAKLATLRYRYGHTSTQTSRLFGISLYQQSHNELSPGDRTPLDTHSLFSASPYLSQVPCSWGALYFPEHWREFHDYLTLRLSEHPKWLALRQVVVPEVRSNKWTRSWKKYFIELAFLRGYVMLYPNYPGLVSLSTNHLEPGVHVKSRSTKSEELFILPLMTLEQNEGDQKMGIMQIPADSLPPFQSLSVLNLTGAVTTMDEILATGQARKRELGGCHMGNSGTSGWDWSIC